MKQTQHSDERMERFVRFRASGDLVEKVARVAQREDRTLSSAVRVAMREYVASREVSGRAA